MDHKLLSRTKLFEKIEIGWFLVEDLRTRRGEFRGFYREIADLFYEQRAAITQFIKSKL
jgi:hypothetical protein